MSDLQKLKFLLESENEFLKNLLQRIKDGDLTRIAIEERLNDLIKKNEVGQNFANKL